MQKLSLEDFKQIRSWMYRNARQLELAIWQYHFENGSKEAVLSALSFYQNEDGGFGRALEQDSWNPNSSPYTTLRAANILESIGITDNNHPMVKGVLKFFNSTDYYSENGWFFNIPSNDDYAHAPWWTYNMEANLTEGIGLTAQIASFVLKYTDKKSELYNKSILLSHRIFNELNTTDEYGDMGLGGFCELLDTVDNTGLKEYFDIKSLTTKIKKLVHNSIERDTTKWLYYTRRPSDYIKSPDSIFYEENKDMVQTELEYLITTRPQNGVWNITWSWFENNEKYAKEFAVSENWWKATKAIEIINFLKSFNWLEDSVSQIING